MVGLIGNCQTFYFQAVPQKRDLPILHFREGGLAGEADAAAIIFVDDLDGDLVADLADFFDILDAVVRQFGDMDHAFDTGQEFDEASKIFDGLDDASVDLADFGFAGGAFDHVFGILKSLGGLREDLDGAVFFDVDLGAGRVGDAADVLSAGADEGADLIGIDLDDNHLRGVGTELWTRGGDAVIHDLADLGAGGLIGQQSFIHAGEIKTSDLEVQLEASDAFGSSGDLEVHVAVVVFGAENIGQEDAFVRSCDETDGDADDGVGDWNARIHKGEGRPANRCHGGRTVGTENFGNDARRVGEVLRHGAIDGAFGESAVADFAATSGAVAADFASGEGREVVVEDEALLGGTTRDHIVFLFVTRRAKCRDDKSLCVATLEEGGTVNARQNADFAGNRADFVDFTTILTETVFQNIGADGLFQHDLPDEIEVGGRAVFGGEFFRQSVFEFLFQGVLL